jgi:hypothetical protein
MSKPNGIFLFTFVLLFLLFHGTGSKVKGRQLEIFFFFLRRISFTIFLNKNEFCRPHITSNKNSAKLRIPSIFGILYTTPRDCPWDLPIIILASRQTLEIVIWRCRITSGEVLLSLNSFLCESKTNNLLLLGIGLEPSFHNEAQRLHLMIKFMFFFFLV